MNKEIAAMDHLVAALWSDLSQYPIVAQKLRPADVPDTESGMLYKVIVEQGTGKLPVLGMVEAEALRRGVTQETIMRLSFRSRHESPASLEAYADEVKNAATMKRLATIGQWLHDEAERGEGDAEKIKSGLLRMIMTDSTGSQELRHISTFAEEAEKDFDQWMKGFLEGRSTGFPALDETFRLVNSELTLIAGRPGSGKTSLTWQMCVNVAEQMMADGEDGVIAVFSADMSGRALLRRAACSIAGVDSRKARRNQLTSEEEAEVRKAIRKLKTLPILIDDSSGPTTDNMYYRMLAASATRKVVMMMFDFAELGGDEGDTEELRISNIGKNLRGICKRLDIPVIVDSQLGRKVEERQDKMPAMSDLRYSGMLEAVADNVLLIMRPEYYAKRGMPVKPLEPGDEEGIAYVIHAKGRNDGVGFYRLGFIEHLSKFEHLDRGARGNQVFIPKKGKR